MLASKNSKGPSFNFNFFKFLNRCSAFYVSKLEDVDGLCHLVDEEDEQTVGHGMDREDIYYIKEVGNQYFNPKNCRLWGRVFFEK